MKALLPVAGSLMVLVLACNGGGGGGSPSAPPPPPPQAKVVPTSFNPVAGMPGTSVTLEGTGFNAVTQVLFGSIPAQDFQPHGDTRITMAVPAGADLGAVTLSLVTATGPVPAPGSFTVLPPLPTLNAPLPAQVAAGAMLVLRGAHFIQPLEITFGGVAAREFTLHDATQVTVKVPLDAASGPIIVRNISGPSLPSQPVEILPSGGAGAPGAPGAAPEITDMHPRQGPAGTRVRVTGRHFLGTIEVSFGATSAPGFEVDSDQQITVTVPDTADTSRINVQTTRSATVGISAHPFRVERPAPAAIHAFHPAKGQPGQQVVINGERFIAVTAVKFGRYTAKSWNPDSHGQVTAVVPEHAVAGHHQITVETAKNPDHPAHSGQRFEVEPPAPGISRFCPRRSRPGARVFIKGKGFTKGAEVFFNHTAAPKVVLNSPEELQAEVPAGAATGFIEVKTAYGSSISKDTFTVDADPPGNPDVFVDSWHITQGIQDEPGKVPLVAGRDGLLRVFVRANAHNALKPEVRATILGGSPDPWNATLPAMGPGVPFVPDQGDLGSSWNVRIPGAVLAPGGRIRLELDPAGALPHTDRSGNGEELPLDVKRLPPPRITLVPIAHDGVQGDVYRDGRTLDDWKQDLYRLFPVANLPAGIDLQVAPVHATTLKDIPHVQKAWDGIERELAALRKANHEENRIYVGVLRMGLRGETNERDQIVRIGDDWSHPARAADLFAHEVGHAMSLAHAPFGVHDVPRDYWPEDLKYDQARIGVYGYDLDTNLLVPPTVKDLMCYGPLPHWISDFSYLRVMGFLERSGQSK